jgi:tRNA uridine 5-carbamoylmethylation protein Kti12
MPKFHTKIYPEIPYQIPYQNSILKFHTKIYTKFHTKTIPKFHTKPIITCKTITTNAKKANNRYEEPDGRNRWDKPLFIVLFDDPVLDTSNVGGQIQEYLAGIS